MFISRNYGELHSQSFKTHIYDTFSSIGYKNMVILNLNQYKTILHSDSDQRKNKSNNNNNINNNINNNNNNNDSKYDSSNNNNNKSPNNNSIELKMLKKEKKKNRRCVILLLAAKSNSKPVCCVIFPKPFRISKTSLGHAEIKDILSAYSSRNTAKNTQSRSKCNHFIFVSDSFSFQARNYISKLQIHCEWFSFNDISFNVLQHIFVPKYSLMSEEDICNLEQSLNRKRTAFPRIIYKVDPVARFLDFRKGQVWKATSKTTGEVWYRYVVSKESIV